ncbi:MAG: hypothetical protein NC122_00605 [Faecalibacterium sp.]|nr:hypothetical protein [Ruminococcus sp.]MCM1392798.1 hypothetical protein [Ruminococcus sp.]MCM1484688.1 hypothetical protein [Faecalibacterium sp.]
MPSLIAMETSTNTAMTNLGSVLTNIWKWITTGLDTITGNPILLIGLGIFVAGAVIGLVYRLIHG